MGFENRADAERFLSEWKERVPKFGLELHRDKTARLNSGAVYPKNRKRRGQGKRETFDFPGFAQMRAKTRKPVGSSSRGRKWLKSVVQGYFNYHAASGNRDNLNGFRAQAIRRW